MYRANRGLSRDGPTASTNRGRWFICESNQHYMSQCPECYCPKCGGKGTSTGIAPKRRAVGACFKRISDKR